MSKPELIMVAGCNAAGKSSFIRTRLSEFAGFEVVMTDVYKSRSKTVIREAIKQGKSLIIETVFNDSSFKDLIDEARNAGYYTSLIALFLDSIQQSIERVAFRSVAQSGLIISGSNIKINFNESFKNIAEYYFYFDQADFIYTGINARNTLLMRFHKSTLISYTENQLTYPQKFAEYTYHRQRLNELAYQTITANKTYQQL